MNDNNQNGQIAGTGLAAIARLRLARAGVARALRQWAARTQASTRRSNAIRRPISATTWTALRCPSAPLSMASPSRSDVVIGDLHTSDERDRGAIFAGPPGLPGRGHASPRRPALIVDDAVTVTKMNSGPARSATWSAAAGTSASRYTC